MSSKTSMRVLGVAAAALLLLGACTGDDDGDAIGPATEPGSQPSEPAAASPGEFGDAAVLTEVEAEDGKFLRVHFLADGDDNDELFEALQACTERYIKDYNRVECYAYASEDAFQAASVDPDNGVVGKDCWVAHLGQDRSGEGVGKLTNDSYEEEGCPA